MAQGTKRKTVIIAIDRSKNAEHAFECKYLTFVWSAFEILLKSLTEIPQFSMIVVILFQVSIPVFVLSRINSAENASQNDGIEHYFSLLKLVQAIEFIHLHKPKLLLNCSVLIFQANLHIYKFPCLQLRYLS